jgi:hypothetical protein
MQPELSIADTGLAFARAIVAGDYAAAHSMLSEQLRREMSTDDLKANYDQMVSYTDSPPDTIEIGQLFEPFDSDGVADGLGWVFVNVDCLHGPDGCWLESIGVLVVSEGPRQAIAQIMWGRD